jgi:acetolactate synthase-1/2/3 large subunit
VSAAERTRAELIADTLRGLDLRSVFAVAGASHAHLLQALHGHGIRIVSNRHESGAVSAADGYARATRGA